MWRKFGCEKFRSWIFFDCFVVLTDWKDVKRGFEQTGEFQSFEEFGRVWPFVDDGLLSRSGGYPMFTIN
jgi:hypothetical protein